MQQLVIHQLQDGERVKTARRCLEIVAGRAAERDQLKELGPVHQIDPDLERRFGRIPRSARDELRDERALDVERRVESELVGVEQRRLLGRPGLAVAVCHS